VRFTDKVLFTTGAGSGLAAATARRFAADGGRVAVADVDGERAEAVAAELDGSIALTCNVADEDSVISAVTAARDQLGRIDCLFNAAGIADFGPIEEWSYERWNRMMAVHAGGTFLVCKHALPSLRERGGSIVNVASVAALVAQTHNAPYGAAKGAILSFSRQLAADLAPDNIRVNVVAPGRVRSGMTTPLYTERGGGSWEKGAAMAGEHNMQRRVGEPEDVANPVCFLLSDEAGFTTGMVYVPDGGETAL
jgi:NAD(P)-dependent dehydrogenase (short-subunit alcohol dehydrogenase family)